MGLPPGHEPGGHLQLWPDPRDLPDRGPGLLHPGQQLRGEELCAAHHVPDLGRQEKVDIKKINPFYKVENSLFMFIKKYLEKFSF